MKKEVWIFLTMVVVALVIAPVLLQAQTGSCPNLTITLQFGSSDAATGGQVSQLQTFLTSQGAYFSGVTGYFGLATEKGVQQFQTKYNLAPEIKTRANGYGVVAQATRAKIQEVCAAGGGSSPSSGSMPTGGGGTTGTSTGTMVCPAFVRTLGPGSTDSVYRKDVSELQTLLAKYPALYPEGLVTGYYGPATQRAVERFQAQNGIVSSGTPSSTGYGQVGPTTRIKLQELLCTSGGGSQSIGSGSSSSSGGSGFSQTSTNPSVWNIQPIVPAGECILPMRTLGPGSTDSVYRKDVSGLQAILAKYPALYPEGLITGSYGLATQRAVERFQAQTGIVSSGTPFSTGYGQVGSATRIKMQKLLCIPAASGGSQGGGSLPPLPPPPTSSSPVTMQAGLMRGLTVGGNGVVVSTPLT